MRNLQQEIQRLTNLHIKFKALPDLQFTAAVSKAWLRSEGLFDRMGKTEEDKSDPHCGCITQIRGDEVRKLNGGGKTTVRVDGQEMENLTEEIRNDPFLPTSPEGVTKRNLDKFLYYQIKMAKIRFSVEPTPMES